MMEKVQTYDALIVAAKESRELDELAKRRLELVPT
jgi:hypothetical protein